MNTPQSTGRRSPLLKGFTLVELMVTISIVAFAGSATMMLSARTFNMLRSANDVTMVTQSLQDRLEQIRGSSWNTVTSDEIPPGDDDDTIDDASDSTDDPTTEVLTDPTVFVDDLEDTEETDPGLVAAFELPTASAANLSTVSEEVTVTQYPTGSTPIRIRRNVDGTVTVLSHNSELVNEESVRIVLQLTWRNSADGRMRTQSAQTIITKNTQ